MNRTLKEATVQRYYHPTTAELNEHLQTFMLAYNHAKRLKDDAAAHRTKLSVRSGKSTPLPLPVTRPSSPWDYILLQAHEKME